jgi:NitT/TauT family transport system substrate-binding protein
VVALAACSERPEARAERLTVATMRTPATGLFFVAETSGCFAAERLEIDEHTFELGRDALSLLRENGADAAIAYETPTARAALLDGRIRVLTALHTSTRDTRIIARRERGLTGLSALRGTSIGLAQGSNADFMLDLVLRFGRVPRSQVLVVDLPPEQTVAALERGELDAAVLADPYAARAERVLGDGAQVFQTELYTEFSLLLTREDVLRTRAGALRKLVRGLACAERIVRERRDEALVRIRTRFPELDEQELRAQLGRVKWGLGLDHVLGGVLRDEAQWLRVTGEARGATLDVQRLLDRRLLEEIEPEAVMLLPSRRGAP